MEVKTMGLKQAIVMKKEFTNKYQSGKHGSTPGKFITRYISRMDAAEPITSLDIKYDESPLFQLSKRYDSRQGLAQTSISMYDDVLKYTNKVKQKESLDGKAFGNKGLAYANKDTRSLAKQVQALYDEGHSVSKLVFSFSHDYMTRHHMVDDDYKNTGFGSLHGHVDQLRVREAVNTGMEALTKEGEYTNPIWVATVHTNTDDLHVHCVLVDDVDLSKSKRLVKSELKPQDYGYVNDTQTKKFRKAMDKRFRELDTMKVLKQEQLSDEFNLDVAKKQIEYSHYRVNNTLQKLTASLPKDTEKWDTHKEPEIMKRPNEWLEAYITEIMQNYPNRSGWDKLEPVMNKRLAQIPEAQRLQYQQYMQDSFYRLSEGHILDDIKDDLEYQPLSEHNMYLTQQAVDNDSPEEMQAAFDMNVEESNESVSFSLRHLIQYQKRKYDHEQKAKLMHEQLNFYDIDHHHEASYQQEPPIRNWYKVHAEAERARVDKYRYLLKGNEGSPKFDRHDLDTKYDKLMQEHTRIEKLSTLQIPDAKDVPAFVGATVQKLGDQEETIKYRDLLNKAYNGEAMTKEEATELDKFGGEDSEMLGSRAYYAMNPNSFRHDSFEEASQYAMSMARYSYECWQNGLIKYNEVEDTYDYMKALMKGFNHEPKKPGKFEDVYTPEYFDEVKGSDLHDMLNDFGENQSRELSDKTINTYGELITKELKADVDADDYLAQRDQESPYITDSLNKTRQYLDFAYETRNQGALPEATPIEVDEMLPETLAEKRNLSAMSLEDAEFDTNKHLQLVHNVAEEYRVQLLEEIRQYEENQKRRAVEEHRALPNEFNDDIELDGPTK